MTSRFTLAFLLLLCPTLSGQVVFPKPAPAVGAEKQDPLPGKRAEVVPVIPASPSHWEGMSGRVVEVWKEFEALGKIDSKILRQYLGRLRSFGLDRPHQQALHGLDSLHLETVELAASLLEFVGGPKDASKLVDTAGAVGDVRIGSICLDVAIRLNSGQLPSGAARLLSHPKKGTRASIEHRLAATPDSAHLEDFLRLAEFGRDGDTRLRAVRLLANFKEKSAVREVFVRALNDSSIPVAFRAVDILGGDSSPESLVKLYRLIDTSSNDRARGYLLFHLLKLQGEVDELLIRPKMLPQLHQSFNSSDPFLVGTAAACLGEYLFRALARDQFKVTDRELLHALVTAVAGSSFYPQFSRFAPLGEDTLVRLTGEDFGHLERRAWLVWEAENIDNFSVVRGNLVIGPSELSSLSISWKIGDTDLRQLGGLDSIVGVQGESVRWLGLQDLSMLLVSLQRLGLLDTRVLPRSFGESISPVKARLEIKVGDKRKPMVFRGDAGFTWLPQLELELNELFVANRWQSLAPADQRHRFVAERLSAWDGAGEVARIEFELALTSERLAHLDPQQLDSWCDHLLDNPANRKLWPPALALDFMEQLAAHSASEDMARKLLACALRQPDQALAAPALAVLADLPEPLRSELMLAGLRRFEPAIASASLSDERLSVRVAAARALGSSGAAGRDALLRASQDRNPLVVRMAVRSLGELGDPTLVPEILSFAQPGVLSSLRREAIVALGQLGDTRAFDTIYKAATEEGDLQLRLAAVNALALLPGIESTKALQSMFPQFVGSQLEYEYIRIITQLGLTTARAIFSAHLESVRGDVSRVAAINLGKIGVSSAADYLIDLLPDYPQDKNLLMALASTTGVDFRTMPDPAGVYAAWWQEHGLSESSLWLERAARNYSLELDPGFNQQDKVEPKLAVAQLINILRKGPAHLRAVSVWRLSTFTGVDCEVVGIYSNATQVARTAEVFSAWLEQEDV